MSIISSLLLMDIKFEYNILSKDGITKRPSPEINPILRDIGLIKETGFMCHEMAIHNAKHLVDCGIITMPYIVITEVVRDGIIHHHSVIEWNNHFYDGHKHDYDGLLKHRKKIVVRVSAKYIYQLYNGKNTKYDLLKAVYK